jgi:branched-chain amino acid transport system permease protein
MLEWWINFWSIYSTVIFSIGINAMLALSIYLTLSCGLLSLANAAFMGLGAYAAAIISMQTALPFPVALLAAAVVPALVAVIIGIPTLRLSGVYLAMATLGFGEVVRVIILNMDITGGPMGLNGIPLKTQWWHIILLLAVMLYTLARLRSSKVGRAFEAIKQDETAARLMGVNVSAYKLLAFVLGAFIAGIAGGLNAHFTFTIGPGNYAFENAVDILTMAVFGGTSNLIGPIIGSTTLTILPELMRSLKDFRLAANGLILILVVLYLPKGIWDPARFRAFWQRHQTKRTTKSKMGETG